jgi:integrase
MGYHKRATIHGFRGLASTVLNESGKFESDWIEKQLAHDEADQVRAAYNSAQWLSQRRAMMNWWSDFLKAEKKIGELLGW